MSHYQTSMPLFDRPSVPVNASVPEEDVPRLSRHHHAILARLQSGPATNLELAIICQRFGARLYELKRAGHPWLKTHIKAGVYEYRLV